MLLIKIAISPEKPLQSQRNHICHVFTFDTLRHALTLTCDPLTLNLVCIGCHVIKLCAKGERNRKIRC